METNSDARIEISRRLDRFCSAQQMMIVYSEKNASRFFSYGTRTTTNTNRLFANHASQNKSIKRENVNLVKEHIVLVEAVLTHKYF